MRHREFVVEVDQLVAHGEAFAGAALASISASSSSRASSTLPPILRGRIVPSAMRW
jgi:hypothetical protein